MNINFEEFTAVVSILTLAVALNVPSWVLAIALWIHILITEY